MTRPTKADAAPTKTATKMTTLLTLTAEEELVLPVEMATGGASLHGGQGEECKQSEADG